jgi:hypothetical protein
MQRFSFKMATGTVKKQISTISVVKKMCLSGEVLNIIPPKDKVDSLNY